MVGLGDPMARFGPFDRDAVDAACLMRSMPHVRPSQDDPAPTDTIRRLKPLFALFSALSSQSIPPDLR